MYIYHTIPTNPTLLIECVMNPKFLSFTLGLFLIKVAKEARAYLRFSFLSRCSLAENLTSRLEPVLRHIHYIKRDYM